MVQSSSISLPQWATSVLEKHKAHAVYHNTIQKLAIALLQLENVFCGLSVGKIELLGQISTSKRYWSGTNILRVPRMLYELPQVLTHAHNSSVKLMARVFFIADAVFNCIGFLEWLNVCWIIGDGFGSLSITAYTLADFCLVASYFFSTIETTIGVLHRVDQLVDGNNIFEKASFLLQEGRLGEAILPEDRWNYLIQGCTILVLGSALAGFGSIHIGFIAAKIVLNSSKIANNALIIRKSEEKYLQHLINIKLITQKIPTRKHC